MSAAPPTARPLPPGWRWARLGDVCPFRYGSALAEAQREPGDVAVYGSNGIIGYHSKALTEGPTVLVGRKGSVGAVHYSERPCWPIDTTYFIDRTDPPCDLAWLSFTLRALNLPSLKESTGVPGLDRNDAHALPIPLPPLPEQRRIAAILRDQLDAVRRAREAALARLQAARALPAAFLRSVFESEGAQAWSQTRLGDVVRTSSGSTPSRERAEYYGGTIPWVKTAELTDGAIDDTQEHVTDRAVAETSLKLLPRGTLLIAMYGQGQTRGRTALLNVEATTNQACFAVLPNQALDTSFLQLWFRHNYVRLRTETDGRGGNQPNLSGDVLRQQLVPKPTLEIQAGIADRASRELASAHRLQVLAEADVTLVDSLPQSLLRQAFAGEL